jgi:hypothetical protein
VLRGPTMQRHWSATYTTQPPRPSTATTIGPSAFRPATCPRRQRAGRDKTDRGEAPTRLRRSWVRKQTLLRSSVRRAPILLLLAQIWETMSPLTPRGGPSGRWRQWTEKLRPSMGPGPFLQATKLLVALLSMVRPPDTFDASSRRYRKAANSARSRPPDKCTPYPLQKSTVLARSRPPGQFILHRFLNLPRPRHIRRVVASQPMLSSLRVRVRQACRVWVAFEVSERWSNDKLRRWLSPEGLCRFSSRRW